MRGFEILDAQIHQPSVPEPWDFGEESAPLLTTELAREAMDSVGVDAALINAKEEFIDAAVRRYPRRFAGCGNAEPKRPDLEEFVAGYRNLPGRLALRVFVRDWRTETVSEDYLSGAMEPLFKAAARFDVPLFLSAQEQLAAAEEILQKHPDQPFILDHLGLNIPTGAESDPDLWRLLPEVNALAVYPNLAIKFCGGEARSSEPFPHRDSWRHLLTMVEAFGPDRLMWASDFTRMRRARKSKETVDSTSDQWLALYGDQVHFIRETDVLSTDDKEKILGETIRRWLRWEARNPAEKVAR